MDLKELISALLIVYLEKAVQTCFDLCSLQVIVPALIVFGLYCLVQPRAKGSGGDEKDEEIRSLKAALQVARHEQVLRDQNVEHPAISGFNRNIRAPVYGVTLPEERSEIESNGLPQWIHNKFRPSSESGFIASQDDAVYDLRAESLLEAKALLIEPIPSIAAEPMVVFSFNGRRHESWKRSQGHVYKTGWASRANPNVDRNVVIGSNTRYSSRALANGSGSSEESRSGGHLSVSSFSRPASSNSSSSSESSRTTQSAQLDNDPDGKDGDKSVVEAAGDGGA